MPVTYDLFFDDSASRPWTYNLYDDDGVCVYESKNYKTRIGAIGAATSKLRYWTDSTNFSKEQ